MPPSKRVTNQQIFTLLGYLEKHKDIKLGIAVPKDKQVEYEHWQKITEILNSLPGDTKDIAKWRTYWNGMKWCCRRKVADGIPLVPYEHQVLKLAGKVSKYPVAVSVIPRESEKNGPEENKGKLLEEKHEDESEDEAEWRMDESILPENRENDYPATDPMPVTSTPMLTVGVGKVENCLSDQDDVEDQAEIEENTEQQASSGEVPEWVRKVEHRRLRLEERTTRAMEQMSAGIASMAEAMHSIVGSLHSIEASIRDLKNKN